MFAAELGRLAGVNVPVIPMAHEYLITKPHGVPLDVPTMRDPSLLVYFRRRVGRPRDGRVRAPPAPWGLDGIPPDFNGKLLAEDWDRFEELMTNALVRVPELGEAEVIRLVNGPEAFTPDGEFILGPTELRGFWVAAGFCAHGLAGAGGMGKLVAEWIVEGLPGFDVWEMDSRRFGAHYASRDYTLARTVEIYSTYYDVKYPGHEREAGRPLRLSPAYPRLVELGAAFGEKSGWERANWFEPNAARRRRVASGLAAGRGGCGRPRSAPSTAPAVRARRSSTRRASPRSTSRARARPTFLERVCDNRVAREVGQITYTSMLNARGGIECDFTVTRLADDRFRIVTGTAFGRHDLAWIRQHAPDDGSVLVEDVTSKLACLGLWGPAAREILQATTTDELAFGYMRARELAVGPGSVPGAPRDLRGRARLGALLPERSSGSRSGTRSGRPGAATGSSPAATRRSTRCAWRRATASGAPTSPRTTRPTRPGSASRSSSTRKTSSGARPCSKHRSPSAGSPVSCSRIPARSRSGRSRCASTASSSAA